MKPTNIQYIESIQKTLARIAPLVTTKFFEGLNEALAEVDNACDELLYALEEGGK